MALVIFNIGWMNDYQGLTESDPIVNGGSYVRENKSGGEVKNFLPSDDGWYYGYVQPPGSGINLKNLGAAPDATHADDVTIVFTATPKKGGNVVVGWYQNACVWRDQQKHGDSTYFAKARTENCTLLPPDKRRLPVPRARKGIWGMGQSNIRYVKDADESEDFVCDLRKCMQDHSGIDRPGPVPSRQQSDPFLRAKVEKAAIKYVAKYYEGKGYECVSVESDNKGWDLKFTRDVDELLVEVKGCSGDAGQVELTPNEYAAMRNRHLRDVYRLAVVTRALDKPRLSIVRFNESDGTWHDQDDRKVRLNERKGVRVIFR